MNPNYQKMMKQVQKMQADMARAQEELANETVEASAGGGMVTVQVTGAVELKRRGDAGGLDPGRHQRGPAFGSGAGQQAPGRYHFGPQHPRSALLTGGSSAFALVPSLTR